MNPWGMVVVLAVAGASLALAGERMTLRNQAGVVVGSLERAAAPGWFLLHNRDGRQVASIDVPAERERPGRAAAGGATVWTLDAMAGTR